MSLVTADAVERERERERERESYTIRDSIFVQQPDTHCHLNNKKINKNIERKDNIYVYF